MLVGSPLPSHPKPTQADDLHTIEGEALLRALGKWSVTDEEPLILPTNIDMAMLSNTATKGLHIHVSVPEDMGVRMSHSSYDNLIRVCTGGGGRVCTLCLCTVCIMYVYHASCYVRYHACVCVYNAWCIDATSLGCAQVGDGLVHNWGVVCVCVRVCVCVCV